MKKLVIKSVFAALVSCIVLGFSSCSSKKSTDSITSAGVDNDSIFQIGILHS